MKFNLAIKQFDEAMAEAKTETEKALQELLRIRYEEKVRHRWARMYAYRLQKAIKDFSHVPSLAESSGGTWPTDYGLFDENDGETESERRMWAARDSYDMRDGK